MPNMKKPVGKVKKTQAQIDAELAAAKKAAEKYRATRPSKEKRSEMINAQQSRMVVLIILLLQDPGSPRS